MKIRRITVSTEGGFAPAEARREDGSREWFKQIATVSADIEEGDDVLLCAEKLWTQAGAMVKQREEALLAAKQMLEASQR